MVPVLGARSVRLVGAAAVTIALGYGAAFAAGLRPPGSLGTFLSEWRFGSPLYALWDATTGSAGGSPSALRAMLLVVPVALVLAAWLRRRPAPSLEAQAACGAVVLALLLALSPVVFPWYL